MADVEVDAAVNIDRESLRNWAEKIAYLLFSRGWVPGLRNPELQKSVGSQSWACEGVPALESDRSGVNLLGARHGGMKSLKLREINYLKGGAFCVRSEPINRVSKPSLSRKNNLQKSVARNYPLDNKRKVQINKIAYNEGTLRVYLKVGQSICNKIKVNAPLALVWIVVE